jgi:uncharacterized LabA/DUF88 family protein
MVQNLQPLANGPAMNLPATSMQANTVSPGTTGTIPPPIQSVIVSKPVRVILPERMVVFFDARNIKKSNETYRASANSNFTFGYKEIMTFFQQKYRVIRGYFYDGAPHKSHRTTGRDNFYNDLRKAGITLRLKEIEQSHPTNKGVDIYLTSDMISLAYEDAYDIAVLVSGDGDYEALIELVKSKGKRVWVVSFVCALSEKLRNVADKVLVIDGMTRQFGRT